MKMRCWLRPRPTMWRATFSILAIILAISSILPIAEAKNVRRPVGQEDLKHELAAMGIRSRRGPFIMNKREVDDKHTECRHVHLEKKDQCAFIRRNCEDEEVGVFSYLELYYCRLNHVRPVALAILALWLGTLFTTIGIAASDFFCINLSTIASVLGMSESMAGVTFLALGNGSPDIFSTFTAMKINSGSLAIGELIGAASFIAAVVVGAMAIVRPFKVARRPFVRDLIFFTIAIIFSLCVLADGEIHTWECAVMVMYYVSYVLAVVAWHWWSSRRRRIRLTETHARDHYLPPGEEEVRNIEEDEDGGVGDESTSLLRTPDIRLLECQDVDGDQNEEEEEEQQAYAELSNNMRVTRLRFDASQYPITPHSIRPSLVGALEFRSVLNSLRKTQNLWGRPIHLRRYSDNPALHDLLDRFSAPGTLMNNTPINSLPSSSHGLPNGRPHPQRGRAVSVNVEQLQRSGPQYLTNLANMPHLHLEIPPHAPARPTGLTLAVPSQNYLAPPSGPSLDSTISSPASSDVSPTRLMPIRPGPRAHDNTDTVQFSEPPRIIIEDNTVQAPPLQLNSGHIPLPDEDEMRSRLLRDSESERTFASGVVRWKKFKYWPYNYLPPPQQLYAKLFPTLQSLGDKGYIEKFMALMAVPSIFLLTITLPVVEDSGRENDDSHSSDGTSLLIGISEADGVNDRTSIQACDGQTDQSSEFPEKGWDRWLMAIQCITGPLFVALAFFGESPSLLRPILYALLIGLVSLLVLLSVTNPTTPPERQHLLCFVGFVVAIAWISNIANEVVGVLKAIGVILNISDAILGLTIFAIGNSLGDLVSNITIARLGFPVMALSACFGGPMLNILLGVGISGLYIGFLRGGESYRVEVSHTLVISSATLLLTLLFLLVSVPLNGWRLGRKIGAVTIALWVISTAINLGFELGGSGKTWV